MLRGANIKCCLGNMDKAEVDDDITYLVLALMMLERHGIDIDTDDVARSLDKSFTCGRNFYCRKRLVFKINRETRYGLSVWG